MTPTANSSLNPFGSPDTVITLGLYNTGWQDPANPIKLSGVTPGDGAWDLGKAGTIAVTVPFAPTLPLAGMYYDVNFQVYSVGYKGITSLPSLTTPGQTPTGLTMTAGWVADDPLFGGAEWDFRQWTGSFNNVTTTSLNFTLNAPSSGSAVVDSYDIFTQYTWHSSDPLARIWDGLDGDDNQWTSKDNWGGIAPITGDNLYFAGGTRLTPNNNMSAGTSFGGITFLSDAGAFTLGGSGITLAGDVTNLSNNLQTIQHPVVLTGVRTVTTNGAAGGITISGAINGATGGIIKTGAGTLTLTSANSYGGNTTIDVGTLALTGAGTIAGSPVISVASGAILDVSAVSGGPWTLGGSQTLTGGGTLNGNTQISGTLAPGSGIGSLTVNGDLSYTTGSIFEWQMSDNLGSVGARGAQYDAVNVSGALSGTNAVFKIVLDGADTFSQWFWNVDRTWSDIFQSDGVPLAIESMFSAFTFANAEGNLPTPGTATRGSFSLSGTSLVWTAVPEPGNALIGLLLASGLLRRRRCGNTRLQ